MPYSTFQKIDGPDLTDFPGTMLYVAPEFLEKISYRGRASDIYQIGVVLYTLLVDAYPFFHDDYVVLHRMIIDHHIVFPEEPVISKNYKNLLKWILAKDPTERPTISEIKTHPGYALLKFKYDQEKEEI